MDDIPGVCLLGKLYEKSLSSKAFKYLPLFVSLELKICLVSVRVIDCNLAQEALEPSKKNA
jgi:hypothetical protein